MEHFKHEIWIFEIRFLGLCLSYQVHRAPVELKLLVFCRLLVLILFQFRVDADERKLSLKARFEAVMKFHGQLVVPGVFQPQ